VDHAGAPGRGAWLCQPAHAGSPGNAAGPYRGAGNSSRGTTTLRVGSHVFANDYRHPVMLAKEAATLDLLSNGRFELGLGAGVGPSDYKQMGLSFESAGTRVSRVEEALHIIKQFFTEEVVNFSGKCYTVTELKGLPKSVQKPHPPIFIGSSGKRMLTIAAREADRVAPNVMPSRPGSGATDATMEDKIAWIRESAGERFEQLELCQTIFSVAITDSQNLDMSALPQWLSMQKQAMSVEEAVAYLLEQRERYGFSYFQVFDGQMENFAPVVARLAGK